MFVYGNDFEILNYPLLPDRPCKSNVASGSLDGTGGDLLLFWRTYRNGPVVTDQLPQTAGLASGATFRLELLPTHSE
ncbi:MAG: hypothetical protein IPK46_22730 [Saprospiraceae bacterium]|nr:hypothetical protein [Saprospiraceae bacterium]